MIEKFLGTGIIEAAGNAIDKLVTSDEERDRMKLGFLNNQLELAKADNNLDISMAQIELEKQKLELEIIKAKRDIIVAETKSESWLTRNWRPFVIIMFAFGAMCHLFGLDEGLAKQWGGHGISDELASQFLDIVMVAVGGYIGSRGVEKGIKTWKSTPLRTFRSTDKVPPKEEQGSDDAKTS